MAGEWHRHEICNKLRLEYDKVFKPEIRLDALKIEHTDGALCLKSVQVPAEILQQLTNFYKAQAPGSQINFNCSLVHNWTSDHIRAVQKWVVNHVPTAKKLIEFSDHTFEPVGFGQALNAAKRYDFKELIDATELRYKKVDFKNPTREAVLVRAWWRKTFEASAANCAWAWR